MILIHLLFCLVGFHGQFDFGAVYGVVVWCVVVSQSVSSWQMHLNGACADLQFNIKPQFLIFLFLLCSCGVEKLVKIVHFTWELVLHIMSAAILSTVIFCHLYRRWVNVCRTVSFYYLLLMKSPFSFQTIARRRSIAETEEMLKFKTDE
jgi:hypothetical protein